MSGPPAPGVPNSHSNGKCASLSTLPNGTSHRIVPLTRSTAVKAAHGGAVQGAPNGPSSGSIFATGAFPIPERFTLITYMFIHGSWIHLLGNMLFLWVFGDNIEDAMGHLRFIMFYLMCGIFAAVLHSWMMPNSELPLIGASGAVAGVIAAYLVQQQVDITCEPRGDTPMCHSSSKPASGRPARLTASSASQARCSCRRRTPGFALGSGCPRTAPGSPARCCSRTATAGSDRPRRRQPR